ncbi:hypothetical protein BCR34DRAFT_580543 [Clohesyomyces aquaticus]|uniref:Uncharacterized protein n=1 Tax=Clohesyomyces aquaticus TaxID=1231657 RepID=A0A1Y1Y5T1_9PLEO|nr:hypothetical protein BCR34DRAFT_580543 [Clohesyomyces aquaticus]
MIDFIQIRLADSQVPYLRLSFSPVKHVFLCTNYLINYHIDLHQVFESTFSLTKCITQPSSRSWLWPRPHSSLQRERNASTEFAPRVPTASTTSEGVCRLVCAPAQIAIDAVILRGPGLAEPRELVRVRAIQEVVREHGRLDSVPLGVTLGAATNNEGREIGSTWPSKPIYVVLSFNKKSFCGIQLVVLANPPMVGRDWLIGEGESCHPGSNRRLIYAPPRISHSSPFIPTNCRVRVQSL